MFHFLQFDENMIGQEKYVCKCIYFKAWIQVFPMLGKSAKPRITTFLVVFAMEVGEVMIPPLTLPLVWSSILCPCLLITSSHKREKEGLRRHSLWLYRAPQNKRAIYIQRIMNLIVFIFMTFANIDLAWKTSCFLILH